MLTAARRCSGSISEHGGGLCACIATRICIIISVMIYPLLAMLLMLFAPAYAGYQRLARDNGNLFFFVDSIELYRFSASEMRLLVLDQGKGDIESMLEEYDCVAGINGGYFGKGEEKPPLGIIRHGGRTLAGQFARGASFTVSGLLYDTGSTICLERSKQMRNPLSTMREALQAGPFLIERGRVVRGLGTSARARRSFIASDGKGEWCIGVTSPLSLYELALWLSSDEFAQVLKPRIALNLDGGGSSFFYTKSPRRYLAPMRSVRSFIGIAPRKR